MKYQCLTAVVVVTNFTCKEFTNPTQLENEGSVSQQTCERTPCG
jgi:hypothetical protein